MQLYSPADAPTYASEPDNVQEYLFSDDSRPELTPSAELITAVRKAIRKARQSPDLVCHMLSRSLEEVIGIDE